MKKSTYIIIGFVCFLCLLTVVLPLLLFVKTDKGIIEASAEYEEIELPANISVVEISSDWVMGDNPKVLIEQDSACAEGAKLLFDKEWADNSEYTVNGDTLTIKLCLYDWKSKAPRGKYISNDIDAARIYLAPGQLGFIPNRGIKHVNDIDVVISNVHNQDVNTMSRREVSLCVDNSEIKSWTHSKGDLNLTLNNPSTISKLTTRRNSYVTTRGTAEIDSIVLCPEGEMKINLKNANFNTLVSDNKDRHTVNLILDAQGTMVSSQE